MKKLGLWTFALLSVLAGCDAERPSASFRLIAEDVTPDRGCTSLGDHIELELMTTRDRLEGPVRNFPGYYCVGWDLAGDVWIVDCEAVTEDYSLSKSVVVVMEEVLDGGFLSLQYPGDHPCNDSLPVIDFENLD